MTARFSSRDDNAALVARQVKWTILQDVVLAGSLWYTATAEQHQTLKAVAGALVKSEPWKTLLRRGAWRGRAALSRDPADVLLKRYRTMPQEHGQLGIAIAKMHRADEDIYRAWPSLVECAKSPATSSALAHSRGLELIAAELKKDGGASLRDALHRWISELERSRTWH